MYRLYHKLYILSRSICFANMKQQLCCHEALAFARMKRSAQLIFHVPKARFIGRSPASFFMHRKVRFIEKSTCFCKCFFLAPPNVLARFWTSNSAYFEPYCSRHELLRNSTLFLPLVGAGCRGQGQEGGAKTKRSPNGLLLFCGHRIKLQLVN